MLVGNYSPSGRLNMTWYKGEEQLSDLLDYDIMSSKQTYMFLEEEPLYRFSHGLSYAAFSYDNFHIASQFNEHNELLATVDVSNSSAITGDEVVQLYVTVAGFRVKRPLKKLVAFAKVTLEPGQTKQVTLSIPRDYLTIWDVTRDQFIVEKCSYTFAVGSTSERLQLSETVQLGDETIPPRNLGSWTRAENYDAYQAVYLDESKEGTTCVVARGEQGNITFTHIDTNHLYNGINARMAGGLKGGKLIVEGDGQVLAQLDVPASEEQHWTTLNADFDPSSIHQLTLQLQGTVKLSGFQLKL